MGRLGVRVVPRSTKVAKGAGVEAAADGIVVRVRAAPEGGRATEEAREAAAGASRRRSSSWQR